MPQPDTSPTPTGDHDAVRIVGVPTEITDHPALRKIARAVLSIAARQLENDTAARVAREDSDD
jgi:hypothetical protein